MASRIKLALLFAIIASATVLAGCTNAGTTPPAPSATAQATSTPPAPSESRIDGTAYYFQSTAGGVQLWSVHDGTAAKLQLIPAAANDPCVRNSVTVSPDGRRLAWVTSNGDPSTLVGTLTVSGLDGQGPRTLAGVTCSLTEVSWTADSGRLALPSAPGTQYLDVTTWTTQLQADSGVVSSANGSFRVRRDSSDRGTFIVETASGAPVRTVTNYTNDFGGFSHCGYTLKGVSDDGRYVTIGYCNTDPGRVLGAHYLYDTVAGKHVTLPVTTVDAVVLLGGGTALVRGPVGGSTPRSLVLVDASGSTIMQVLEPAALPTDAVLLRYVQS